MNSWGGGNILTRVDTLENNISSIEENTNTLKSSISDLNTTVNNIINILHPIGSIYMSFDPTNPKDIFGGEWEQIKDRFIYAAGSKSVNATGGEENHKLTISEMPSHNHVQINYAGRWSGWPTVSWPFSTYGYIPNMDYACNNTGGNFNDHGTTTNHGTTGSAGSTGSHNNMPPYLVAYVWKRTK